MSGLESEKGSESKRTVNPPGQSRCCQTEIPRVLRRSLGVRGQPSWLPSDPDSTLSKPRTWRAGGYAKKPARKGQNTTSREVITLGSSVNPCVAWVRTFSKAPREGFEPSTRRLTAGCSTVELSRNSALFQLIERVGTPTRGEGEAVLGSRNGRPRERILSCGRLFRASIPVYSRADSAPPTFE